ncbi:MAG: hypothetical protein CSA07_02750 [Bacteroidia bacterium]|nr:MAG: hypothetical protein CSA07_02750 [Bacteroidia bacterium]
MARCSRLIQLGDKIVDAQILRAYFACDLSACHGACCLEGDSGAPLESREIVALDDALEALKPLMSHEGAAAVGQGGVCFRDGDGDWVTTLVRGKECAFSFREGDCYLCAVERGLREGKSPAQKPLSCALYPIRVGRSGAFDLLRYDRWEICEPAVENGRRQGIRLYEFLREPLVRAFGEAFYEELAAAAEGLGEDCG